MSDCRFGVSPVNYPDPDPAFLTMTYCQVKVQVYDQIFFAKDCMPCNRLCRNCSCYWSIFRRCLSSIKVYRYNPTEICQQRLQGVRNVAQKLCSWERSLTYVFLRFLSFYRRKKKKEQKQKEQKNKPQKNCIDPESNQERLDHQSCILPLHWCIRWGITTERVFLNNGDYLNYNLYWFFNGTD